MTSVEIVVHGRHLDISNRFREHATEKVSRIDRFGVQIDRVDLELSKEPNPRLSDRAFKVELTCRGRGAVIRAEACSADKYSALDLAAGKLEERLRRAHDRSRVHKGSRHSKRIELPADGAEYASAESARAAVGVEDPDAHLGHEDEVYAFGPIVVRDKTHPTEPMTIAQAVTEMELVGHDFYLFHDIDSDAPAVVYFRKGYDYGLIRIDTASSGVRSGES